MQPLNGIDEIITTLGDIILEAEANNDTSGYFAALYRKVTIKVKEGIANNEFEDGPRMEKLDIVFASRYIDAYYAWKKNEPVTIFWKKAFEISTIYWPVVLHHLLMGMNAHINLDLGIAAAEVSKNKNIHELQNDFNKINAILSSLVMDVQNNLAEIWPRLKWILQRTGRVDDFMVDFSMQLARDGAWKFALSLAENPNPDMDTIIRERDIDVSKKINILNKGRIIAKLIFGIIRIGERGTVRQKIGKLK
jgi:Family of unknown function (DUF5995)